MIPRFVIQNGSTGLVLQLREQLDFEVDPGLSHSDTDLLVLGTHIMSSRISQVEKNPLLKTFDAKFDTHGIIVQAKLHKQWNAAGTRIELLLGDPPRGKIMVTKVGVVIDSCLVPIAQFHQLEQTLLGFKNPFIVTHEPLINRNRPFLTIGCADYSMEDISKVLTTYYSIS